MSFIDPEEPVSAMRGIPIHDNGEPLVDFVEHYPELVWVERHPVFDYQRHRLSRLGVAERLGKAAAALPEGIRLAVVEGWRPPEVQRRMYAATQDRLSRAHPEWDAARLQREVERFSAPMDNDAPPPHTTGGAVDVHLVDADGQPLDLTSPFEMLDGAVAPMAAPGLSEASAANRDTLRAAMESAGFTNYPLEFWHWSYGDQAWAYRGSHPAAHYAAIQPGDFSDAEVPFSVWEEPGFGA